MKIDSLALNTMVAMKRAVVAIGLIGAALLGITPLALANSNENTDVVAPYLHFPGSTAAAPGPFTTHYIVSNMASTFLPTTTVNVKCYNDLSQRVGPAAGTNLAVGLFEMNVATPVSLGLTTDPNFTGVGWCYFASNGFGGDIAVSFLMGISVAGNLMTTNNSVGIMADTAQGGVTNSDANVPYWTNEGNWTTYILALNPTATGRTIVVDVYNSSAVLLSSGPIVGTLAARDMEFAPISSAAATFGAADINVSGRGFAGWIAAFNFVSYEGFIYQIPLDKDDVSKLVSTDRP